MHVAIFSKDPKNSSALEKLIKKLSETPEQLDVFTDLADAKEYLRSTTPDIIFNYCENEVLDFFELYKNTDLSSKLVFLAGNDKYMASSFLFNTLNFIVGTFDEQDILFCFNKYKTYTKNRGQIDYLKDIQKLTKLLSDRNKDYKKRFMVRVGNSIKSVSVEDISYFFSADRINYLVKFNGKKFPIDNTLDEVESLLDPDMFFRANRQFMINIDSIAEIHPYFKGRVKLDLNPKQEGDLVISAEKSRSFKDWLDE